MLVVDRAVDVSLLDELFDGLPVDEREEGESVSRSAHCAKCASDFGLVEEWRNGKSLGEEREGKGTHKIASCA